MMDFLVYDGKVAVALLVFYLFYRFLLKKETFHRFNRVVLVGTAVLSFLLPLCIITIHKPIEVAPVIPEPAIVATEVPAQELVPLVEPAVPWWPTALTILFWAGVAFVLARVTLSILSIVRIIRRGRLAREEDGCKIIVTERDIDPFSWMKYIVLSGKDWEAPHASILAHEKAHIGLGHSLEVLLVDILSALQWFNPAIWMLRADLQELHEYEADDAVLRAGTNIKEYQYLLIRKAVSKSGYSVANSFNHSILKNRITMMSKSKSPLSRGLRVLWMLPLVCLAIGLQARTVYVPTDKGSENSLIGETSMLSGSAWKGDEGVLSFFDKTFEIRSENFVISGDYSLEGSSVTLTFKKVRNETTGKEKQGEDSLTGAIEGNILTIQLDKTTATFRRIVPDETSNHVLPEVTVVKYAPAHVKPEDIIHASDLENFKATGEADFDIAPKCDENFALWLNSRIKYPAECLWEGTALVQFTVDKKGKVRGVNVLHGVCDELDNGNSKATVKLNSFLSNQTDSYYHFPGGEKVMRHANFRVIAAGNTDGNGADINYSTREKIEESVQQRMIPIYMGYDNRVEKAILSAYPDWFEFGCAFRAATDEWEQSSGIPAQGIFTTRDAFRIKQYLENGSFTKEKIMNYEFVQTKEAEYLGFLKSAIAKRMNNKSGAYDLYVLFADLVGKIRKRV